MMTCDTRCTSWVSNISHTNKNVVTFRQHYRMTSNISTDYYINTSLYNKHYMFYCIFCFLYFLIIIPFLNMNIYFKAFSAFSMYLLSWILQFDFAISSFIFFRGFRNKILFQNHSNTMALEIMFYEYAYTIIILLAVTRDILIKQ